MARRLLTLCRAALWLACFTHLSCRRHEPDRTASPSASAATAASASATRFATDARAAHFESELQRARARWSEKPTLTCAPALSAEADLELCRAANEALAKLASAPQATPEQVMPTLAESALALARFSRRVRFLSLTELSTHRLGTADKAPLAATAATAATAAPSPRTLGPREHAEPTHASQRALERELGPVSRLMASTVRLERDVIRALGAYLEYAELPVRQLAVTYVSRLREQHPQWPLLDGLIHEALILETDSTQKQRLSELARSALPDAPPAQSAASKYPR